MQCCRATRTAVLYAQRVRSLSSSVTPGGTVDPRIAVFDRNVKRQQRNNAALVEGARNYDYLHSEIADRLADRLEFIKREFPRVVDLGSGPGRMLDFITKASGVKEYYMVDMAERLLYRDADQDDERKEKSGIQEIIRIHHDEEAISTSSIPREVDAVISCLSLHWINDLPGVMSQARSMLKEDGLFLSAMFGGDTLQELRSALALAEMEREGGVSPHLSPYVGVRDAGSLLGRAGFNLTTVDVDTITVEFDDAFSLMRHLGIMGEGNAVGTRRKYVPRTTLAAAAAIYEEMYGENGTIPATFQVIYMIGWSPSASQPKALERGSAEFSLKDLGKGYSNDTI